MEGQMTIFDIVDMPCGRMSPEPCQAEPRREKTSASSLKSSAKSSTRMPLFLYLTSGQTAEQSWDRTGALLGEFMTHSTTESLKEEDGFVSYVISMGTPPRKYCLTLNCSDKPRVPNPTKLSQILEEEVDPKYRLSPRACKGILNRAEKRGKDLPEELKTALERQADEGSRD